MNLFDLNAGILAPVADEVDIIAPIVKGQVPEELNGTLVRNGPNPFSGRFDGSDVLSWWSEATMLHGLSFRNGCVERYRNRWVRTRRWAEYWSSGDPQSLIDTNPNVNVIKHGGEILALAETEAPLAITSELATLGPSRYHPSFIQGGTGHPKIDPLSGELIWFRTNWNQSWLRYGVTNADGAEQISMDIDVSAPAMMHDIAITETHSILLDLNVAYDFSLLSQGYRIPLRWHDDRPARLGIIPRHGGQIKWLDIESCFIQHIVNAYNAADGTIVLNAVRYPWYLRLDPNTRCFQQNPLAVLWRYFIDTKAGKILEQQLDDTAVELPRINETHSGRNNRYVYAVEQPTATEMRGIIRYDLDDGSTQRYPISKGNQNSEPVFVPRPQAKSEDDGWLRVCVYQHTTDCSDVIILDARDITSEPLAIISLPRRIPAGFHGAWLLEL